LKQWPTNWRVPRGWFAENWIGLRPALFADFATKLGRDGLASCCDPPRPTCFA